MFGTNKFAAIYAQIKTDAAFFSFLALDYVFMYVLKAMDYAKGPIEILQGVMENPVGFAIQCIDNLQLLLSKRKTSMKDELNLTVGLLTNVHDGLVSDKYKFTNALLFFMLCFKTLWIATVLFFQTICIYVVQNRYLAVSWVSSFVEQFKTNKTSQKLKLAKQCTANKEFVE